MSTDALPLIPPTGGDAFAAVQGAVLAVWPRVRDHEAGPSAAERNLMLDACGSDHRPLLELVLELGRSVRPALAPQVGRTLRHDEWTTVRAAQVHRLVATRYLQHDVTRWAVDVWGLALGVAPRVEPVVAVPPSPTSASASPSSSATAPRAATPTPRAATPSRVPAAKLGVPPSAVPAALKQVPSWAGGPVSFGVGATPKASTLATLAARGRVVVQHGASGPIGPMWQPIEKRAAAVFAGLVVISASAMFVALQRRDRTTVPVAPVATAPTAPAAAAPLPSAPATTNGLDSTASVPAAIGYALVPLPAARADSARPVVGAGTSVRDRGVAGRYRVVQSVRSVDGTENCDAVARALGAGRVSEEVITHVPGAAEFTIATRRVKASLAEDGWFVAEPSRGTTDNITWQFQLRGRFTANGFAGESETLTDAIIRWGRRQTCVVSADLVATRIAEGAL
ncbi:MAG: hypothetical protein K2R93_06400 [Gemmatimonadaceae bacterium]|nr:hypothetical protein [Gemmatimonadaceae bacterium]